MTITKTENPKPENPANLLGFSSGANRDRTGDLLLAKQALSQLSYTPFSGIRRQGSGIRTSDY